MEKYHFSSSSLQDVLIFLSSNNCSASFCLIVNVLFCEDNHLFHHIQILVHLVSLLSEGNVAESEVIPYFHVGVAFNGLAAAAVKAGGVHVYLVFDRSLNDYASRIWSGLIRDYYLPRWEHWFDSLEEGVPFDFDNWEYSFAENGQELSPAETYGNLQKAAADLVSDFKDISLRPRELPGWTPYHLKKGSQRFSYMLYPADFKTLKGLGFKHIGGDGSVRIDKIRLRGAKQPILDAEAGFEIGKDNPYAEIRLQPDKNGPVKYIYLDVFVTADRDGEDSDILIELK